MRTGARLAAFGLALLLAFGGAFAVGRALEPVGLSEAEVEDHVEVDDHEMEGSR